MSTRPADASPPAVAGAVRARPPAIGGVVVGLAVALTLLAVVLELPAQVLSPAEVLVLLAFALVMTVGETLPLGGLTGRSISPVATAAALALAMCSAVGHQRVGFGAGTVGVCVVLSMVLGVTVLYWRTGRRARPAAYAVRLLMVALVALVYRQVPLPGGGTMLERSQVAGHVPRPVALGMLLLLVAAQGVELVVHVVLRSRYRGLPWRQVLHEDRVRNLPVSAAAISTAVAIALGARSLGLWAIPCFLLPLTLMRYAIGKQERTGLARRQAIAALSQLTDRAGYTRAGHSRRVAALSGSVGRRMQLSKTDLVDLEAAALLHDIGQVSLRRPIPYGSTTDLAPFDQQRIADDSAAIVRRTGVLDRAADLIREHPVPYRVVREEGRPVSVPARILKVCNAYDDLGAGRPERREAALERIMLGLGYEYDPEVVDAVVRITGRGRGSRV